MTVDISLPSITADEYAEISEIGGVLWTYVNESMAKFYQGELDVNDDEVWNKYVEQCKTYGTERLCEINDELSAIALEKGCAFLNLWEALADENGDLQAEYAQNDGYHVKPEGYTAWVDYLRTHTINPGVTSAAA